MERKQKKGKKAARLPKIVNGTVLKRTANGKTKATPNGDAFQKEIVVNEAVGVHFRADVDQKAPAENDEITLRLLTGDVVPLVVRNVKALDGKSSKGQTLVQAFTKKGSGDYKKLAEQKGQKATVTWKAGAK